METNEKIAIICKTCGSDDVRFNADVVWDAPRQRYDIVAVFQNVTCEDCGGETSVKEVKYHE